MARGEGRHNRGGQARGAERRREEQRKEKESKLMPSSDCMTSEIKITEVLWHAQYTNEYRLVHKLQNLSLGRR